MEENNEADLPEPVFVRGFLRTYAIYLGLDPQEMLEAYKAEHGEIPLQTPPPLSRRSERRASGGESRRFWIGLLAIVMLVGLIWELAGTKSHRPLNPIPTIRRVLRRVHRAAVVRKTRAPSSPHWLRLGTVGDQVYYAVYSNDGISVHATFSGPCWVAATADGIPAPGVTYGAGETAGWRAGRQLGIRFGAPANASLSVNGIGLGPAGPGTTPLTLIFTAYPLTK